MKTANRLRGVGIAFAILLISAPIAIVATIGLIPLWSRIESTFQIESIGHSGPAEWCYLLSYIIILTCAFFIWRAIRQKAGKPEDTRQDAAKPIG